MSASPSPVPVPGAQQPHRRRALAMMTLPCCLGPALLSASALGLAGCGRPEQALGAAPAFDYTLLDGRKAHSSGLQGRVLLVNFWATTCAVCVKEMPDLAALHLKYQAQGLHTLAVAVKQDPPALVASFAQQRQLPFDVVIDNTGAIAQAFGSVRGTPTTFVIDRQGRIQSRIEGAPDFARLQAQLAGLLAQS